MARKKKHPEHVNLERYLISYADFITLLFATFVVLYALSQVDINDFKSLQDSMREAFSAPSIMQGSDGVMSNSSDSILEGAQADSVITPLMMEYMSQKYEQQSFDDIEKSVGQMSKSGDLDGVETIQTDRGLIIRFNNDFLFKPGSATLSTDAKHKLDKVGAAIAKKFILHSMRIEGHTDNVKMAASIYPSNWELSSARASSIIRYFIDRFRFLPDLFTAVGFADTRPIADNTSLKGQAQNRRVEILILKNKFKAQESPQDDITKMNKKDQDAMQANRNEIVNKIENMSDAAKELTKDDRAAEKNAIILNQAYEKELDRLSKDTNALDNSTKRKVTGQGGWLKPPGGKTPPITNSHALQKEINKEFKGAK